MNFTTGEGERVYFDSNGDSPARYELVNLQMTNKGTMAGVTVGIYDASLPESHQFIMNNMTVVWGNGLTEVKQALRFGLLKGALCSFFLLRACKQTKRQSS